MDNFKKSKGGFLLGEETLKIIVAVICVVFLIYLLGSIYSSNISAKKLEEAKSSLSRIELIVYSLEDGAEESQDILNPTGWYLYSFVEGERPNSCLNENCLCICDNSFIEIITSQAEKCDKDGVCLNIPSLVTSDKGLKIEGSENFLFIEIKKNDGKIFIRELK